MSIEFWSLIFVWFIGFIIPLLILIGILRWTKLGKFLNQVVDKVVDFAVAHKEPITPKFIFEHFRNYIVAGALYLAGYALV
jgi:hypothetical protein